MHSIERYGIVALLFLIVTVVAVLMWDGGKEANEKKAPELARAPARVEAPLGTPAAGENRLGLVAQGEPGPLLREHLRGKRGGGADPRADQAAGAEEPGRGPQADAFADPFPLQPEAEPASELQALEAEPAPRAKQTPPEQPAREERIAQGGTRAYQVRAGDTLSEIAQRELGSSRRWQEIVKLNPGLDPARVRSGQTIQLPGAAGKAEALQAAPASAPKTAQAKEPVKQPAKEPETKPAAASWKVGQGESLWRIAEKALGDGRRWQEIVALNPGLKPDKLAAGQVLKLPASAKAKAGASRGAGAATASAPAAPRGAPVVASQKESAPAARRGGKVK